MKSEATRRYMGRVAELGCIACRMDGYGPTPAQVHHPRAKAGMSERGDDMETIPLCISHHLYGGKYPDGTEFPAVHSDTAAFRKRYGSDQELSEITQKQVAELERLTTGRHCC